MNRASLLFSLSLLLILLLQPGRLFALGGEILPPYPLFAGDTARQEGAAMAVGRDGSVAVTGYRNMAGDTNDDFLTVLFAADGSGPLWSAPAIFDQAGGSDRGVNVAIDSSGDLVVTGFVTENGKRDIVTIKYDGTDGTELWRARYNGPANGHDIPVRVVVDDRDNVYVGGQSQNAYGNNDILILKYSSDGPNGDGSPLWNVRYNGPANGADEVTGIAVAAGAVAVTGYSWNGSDFDIVTLKYTEEGGLVWGKREASTNGGPDWGKSVAVDPLGRVVMTGFMTVSNTELQKNIVTIAYGDPSSGGEPETLWRHDYDGGFDDEPVRILYRDGSFYVTGITTTISGNRDILTFKLTPPSEGVTPTMAWSARFHSVAGENDEPVDMVMDNLGSLYVTGTASFAISNTITLKYRATDGTLFWSAIYPNPTGRNNGPVGIGVSEDDSLFVAGSIERQSSFDIDLYLFRLDPGMINPPTSLTSGSLTKNPDGTYSVTLSWVDNADNEDAYILERQEGSAPVQEILLPPNSTSYTESSLTEWTRYAWRVKARSNSQGDSHYSNELRLLALMVNNLLPAWTYGYNGLFDSDEYATSIAIGDDDNPIVTGSTIDFAPGYTEGTYSSDYLTVKLDRQMSGPSAGEGMGVIWKTQFEGGFNQEDEAKGVTVDTHGRVVVTGNSLQDIGSGENVNSIVTIAYPPAGGDPLWTAQFNGPAAIDDRVRAVTSIRDGSDTLAVIGHGRNLSDPVPSENVYLITYPPEPALDPQGRGLSAWSATPLDLMGGNDFPSAVAFDPDGNIVVSGYGEIALETGSYRSFVIKYCNRGGSPSCQGKSPGEIVWLTMRTDIPTDNRIRSMTLDPSGDIYVAGFLQTSDSGRDMLVSKHSGRTGELLWSYTYRSPTWLPGDDEAIAVRFDPIDGRVIVAGNSDAAFEDSDIVIISLDASNGIVKWVKSVPSAGYDEFGNDMTIDLSGNIFVVGSSTGPDLNTDILTVSFDYDGNILGRSILDYAGGIDEGVVAATNRLGELFVAGYGTNASQGINGNNTDLVVYKVNGTRLQAPYPVTITEHYTSLTIAWSDNAAGESGYMIDRKNGDCPPDVRTDDPQNPWSPVIGSPLPPDATSYGDSGLTIGHHYCYRIRAFALNGETTRWVPRHVVMSVPPPPQNLLAEPISTTSIRLSWSDLSTSEDGYFIERCSGIGCTFDSSSPGYQTFTTPQNATSFTDTSLCSGTVYRYRIQGFRSNAWRTPFVELPGEISPLSPAAPASVAASPLNEREIRLSWNRVTTDEEGYDIWRCVDQGGECTDYGSTPVMRVMGQMDRVVDNPGTIDSTIRYRISAFREGSCSWETPLSPPVAVQNGSSRVTITSDEVTSTSATIRIDDTLAHESGYRIERCTIGSCSSEPDFTTVATLSFGATTYTDTSLCQGTGYGYRVRGVSDGLRGGGGSSWSQRLPVTITNFRPRTLMKLIIPWRSGMKEDFSDIRFVDPLSRLELPYWIESKNDGGAATVWFITGQNDRVDLYFGNPSASQGSVQWATLGRGLVGFWPFNEPTSFTSGTISDVSGNNFGATAYLGTGGISAAGRIGNGLLMNGSQSVHVNESGNTLLDFTGSHTLEIWYQYQPSPDWARLLSKPTQTGAQPWDIYSFMLDNTTGNQKVSFRIAENNVMPSREASVMKPEGLVPGSWYHLVGRYDRENGKISLFVNGVEYSSSITPLTLATNDAPLGIGSRGWYGNQAYGVMDEVRLYNVALSDDVIRSHYADPVPTATLGSTAESGTFSLPPWSGSASLPDPYLTVTTSLLSPPVSASATYLSESEVHVSWVYPEGGEQSGFVVERCLDPLCSSVQGRIDVPNPSDRSVRDTGLLHDTTYYYRVRAVKESLCRAESPPVITGPVTTTLRAPILSAPITVSISYDCADIRLFDSDGTTPIPFWVENCKTPKTTLWTKWSSLAGGTRDLTLYYANPLAADVATSPQSIFTLFDDFSGSSIDTSLWTIPDASGWSVSNGHLVGTNTSGTMRLTRSYDLGYTTEAKFRMVTAPSLGMMTGGLYYAPDRDLGWYHDANGTLLYRINNGWENPGIQVPLNRYMQYVMTVKSGALANLALVDLATTFSPVVSHDFPFTEGGLDYFFTIGARFDGEGKNYPFRGEWDWVRVRRYLDPTAAPVATLGVEESGPFAGMGGWLHRRRVTVTNPGVPLSYTPPDGYQIAITMDTTPLATDTARLTWVDTTGSESGFVVERCRGTASECTAGAFPLEESWETPPSATTGSSVQFIDRVMEKGSDYCYRVKAVRSGGWGETGYSDIACVRTSDIPSPPVLSGVGYESRIDLIWSAPDTVGETGFEVDRCSIVPPAVDCSFDTGRDPGFPKVAPPNATLYGDTTACGTYKYRVRSFKEGASVWPGWSNEVILSTTRTTPPTTLTAVVQSDLAVRLSWVDMTGDESGFELWRCQGSGCDFSSPTILSYPAAAGIGTTVTVSDGNGLIPGITYRYRVRGVKSGSSCGWPTGFSEPLELIFNASAPVSVIGTSTGTTQATVSWTDTTLIESGFRVERCVMPDGYTPCSDFALVGSTTTPNATTFTDTGVCAGSGYLYRVEAVGSGNFLSQSGGGCWSRRKKLSISSFRGNFLLRMTIAKEPSMKSDYSDLRFFDTVAGSELPYWIDTADGSSVSLWLKLGSNDSVYLYYGNPQASAVSSVTAVFGSSLKGYWPFSQPAGTVSGTLADASGNGNNPTMVNMALPHGIVAGGPFGNALSLDGVNDYANKTGYLTNFPTGNVISVEAWVYPKGFSYDYNGVMAYGTRNATQGFGASFGSTGKPQLPTWNNDFFSPGDPVPLNQWSHVVWVLNGKNVSVYVNGVKSTGSLPSTPYLSPYHLSIGTIELYGGSRYFSGLIDEVRIYNTSITDGDVAARYAPTPPTVTLGVEEIGTPCMNQYVGTPSLPGTMATPLPGNIVTNGDFETTIWGRSYGVNFPVADTTIFFNGRRSMRIDKSPSDSIDGGYLSIDNNSYITGQTYMLSGYIKTALTPGAVAYCDLYSSGKLDSPGVPIAGTTGWTRFTELVTIPAGVTFLQVRCHVEGSGASGSAWFDMIQLAPVSPLLTVTRLSEGRVKLSWPDQQSEESGYRIQRCEWGEGASSCISFATIAEVGVNGSEYVDASVDAGKTYTYRIQSFRNAACGWSTQWSNEAVVSTSVLPPGEVTASPLDTTTISLSWTSDLTTETGFIISRSESPDGGGSWSPLTELPQRADAGARTFRDDTVCPGVWYRYAVTAFKNGLSGGGGECWTRKRLVTISPFIKDFQVRLFVPYDAAGMRSDYGDLRFYDPVSGIQLPYWIESSDGTGASVWVRTSVSPVIEMYYGNSKATSQENPKRVFELFDDFTGTVIDTNLWNRLDPFNLFSQGGELVKASPSPGTYPSQQTLISTFHIQRPFVLEGSLLMSLPPEGVSTYQTSLGVLDSRTGSSSYDCIYCFYRYMQDGIRILEDSTAPSMTPVPISNDSWYDVRIDVKGSGADYYLGPRGGSLTLVRSGTYSSENPLRIGIIPDNRPHRYDNFRVRKYAYPEPSASIGGVTLLSECPTFTKIWVSAQSSHSNAVKPPLPQPPILNGVTAISDTRIDLSWSPVNTDQSGFRISRCSSEGVTCEPAPTSMTASHSATSYGDLTAVASTRYCYRVDAYKDAVCSTGWNAAVSDVLCVTTMPAAAAMLTATPLHSRGVRLDWIDNALDEDGYEVQILVNRTVSLQGGVWSTIATLPSDSRSYFHTQGVEPGRSYAYRVRPFRGTDSSPWAGPAYVTLPLAVDAPAPNSCP